MDSLSSMQTALENALDELASPRSTSDAKSRALSALEHALARVCVPATSEETTSDDLAAFQALQYTFEANLASRLLACIALMIPALATPETHADAPDTIARALALIQGAALTHPASKRFLGRRYPLEVLLDLLLAARALPPPAPPAPPLAAVVLDTLLCILVDAPPALRALEAAEGLPAVVRLLKRAGTPREVRMKCLEFLYFYLLDEAPDAPASAPHAHTHDPRSASSSSTASSASFASSTSSRTSTSSMSSVSSVSSASSIASAPKTPSPGASRASSPALRTPFSPAAAPRALAMLRRDVDFVPLSPKKARIGTGVVPRRPSRLASGGSTSATASDDSQVLDGDPTSDSERGVAQNDSGVRTTAEKRALLGTLLGNVDALVEGVRKAGIWGLG